MLIKILEGAPKKNPNQTLAEYSESLTDWYIDKTTPEYRKEKGQFFTPALISKFMVQQIEDTSNKEEIRILDPGAGIGIFESVFCEQIKAHKKKVKLSFDLYENDPNLLLLLKLNMEACKADMAREGFEITYRRLNEDFILANASIFNDKRENFDEAQYDLVIFNPPYYKLNKESPQAVKTKDLINGQSNIYPLFMAMSAKLLRNDGQMIVLTPRSYCSGLYFKKFRTWFFDVVKPLRIHIFESRKEIFKKYQVLQENMILTARKTSTKPKSILISKSNGIPDENEEIKVRSTTYEKVIVEKNDDVFLRIPTSELDELIATSLDRFDNNLESFGLKVSTGPVVPFRAKKFLLKNIKNSHNLVPLIWMHNIVDGMVKWPVKKNNKHIAIRAVDGSKGILVPNKNYILIKRISTKEGKNRINAGIHLQKQFNSKKLGIENHVNYIYKIDGNLTINEAYGITALLNSRLYNRYFQTTNGSTQVNASEIANIPLPSIETIREIGRSIRKLKSGNNATNEHIIVTTLKIDEKIRSGLIPGTA